MVKQARHSSKQWAALAKEYMKLRNFDMAYQCFFNASSKERQIKPEIFIELGDYFVKSKTKESIDKALQCYDWAADAGSAEAYLRIGRVKKYLYLKQYRVDQARDSFNAFAMAYQCGLPEGAYQAGILMMDDAMRRPDVRDTAIEWFQEAISSGIYKAYSAIGRLYMESPFSTPADEKDDHKALYWFFRGCLYDDPDSLYYAGVYVFRGIATAKDTKRGLKLLKKAGALKQVQALVFLGNIYRRGMGTAKNVEKALSYYEEAGALGSEDGKSFAAMTALEEGKAWLGYDRGHPVDEEKAARYLKKTVKNGYLPAAELLGSLYEKGIGGAGADPARALKCYQLARKAGVETADGKFIRLCLREADRIKAALEEKDLLKESSQNNEDIQKKARKAVRFYKKAGLGGSLDGWALLADFYLKAAPVLPIQESQFLRAVRKGQGARVLDTRVLVWKYYAGFGRNGKYFHTDKDKAAAAADVLAKAGYDHFKMKNPDIDKKKQKSERREGDK
jgi:TPR repeat protein